VERSILLFSYGGRKNPPGPGVGFLTGSLEGSVVATADPVSGQGQGDYASLQPEFPDATNFVGGGYVSPNIDAVVTNRWIFTRFGRGSRASPAGAAARWWNIAQSHLYGR
jgi:hypothetical protein